MIRRLYIDNYKCFSNFELRLDKLPCSMIIGANGSGKSTVAEVLSYFSAIGRGVSNINNILPKNAQSTLKAEQRTGIITLEIEVGDLSRVWVYSIGVKSDGGRYRVSTETLNCGEVVVFDRSQLRLSDDVLAMAVIADESQSVTLVTDFRFILNSIYVLRPVPQKMGSMVSTEDSYSLRTDASNFASWLQRILISDSEAYGALQQYLKCVLVDFANIQFLNTPAEGHVLMVVFNTGTGNPGDVFTLGFDRLSDGEKCQFIAASLITLSAHLPNLTVFWDEPDNYITTSEVAYLLPALCNCFQKRGQLIVSSHSREAIVTFGENEIISFKRPSHYSPVRQPQTAQEMRESGFLTGSLDEALQNGDAVS